MFRFYALALIFSLSGNVLSGNAFSSDITNEQFVLANQSASIVTQATVNVNSPAVKVKQAQLMPTSTAILLIAIGFALVFLDNHLKKSKNRKK